MKVLGIGLPKTGTSSLVEAFKMLGYKAERVNKLLDHPDDMHDWALVKKAMKKIDAGVDEMFCLQLDKLAELKGVKFVLTTRPLDEWKSSVKWYYNNDFPTWWAKYVGRPWEEVFIEYHKRVPELLGDRVLIFDGQEDGWGPLCEFLRRPTPKAPYPHLNKTADAWVASTE